VCYKQCYHYATWATASNLKLNPTKTIEIVFTKKGYTPPPPIKEIVRVDSIKILGVQVDKNLKFEEHTRNSVTSCNQSLFALRTLKIYGCPLTSIQFVFRATLISKLLYASPSWWGFTSNATRDMIEGFLRRARKLQYYDPAGPNEANLASSADTSLFRSVISNPFHTLYQFLPPPPITPYNLRGRAHHFELPRKDDRNFLNRMLFVKSY